MEELLTNLVERMTTLVETTSTLEMSKEQKDSKKNPRKVASGKAGAGVRKVKHESILVELRDDKRQCGLVSIMVMSQNSTRVLTDSSQVSSVSTLHVILLGSCMPWVVKGDLIVKALYHSAVVSDLLWVSLADNPAWLRKYFAEQGWAPMPQLAFLLDKGLLTSLKFPKANIAFNAQTEAWFPANYPGQQGYSSCHTRR